MSRDFINYVRRRQAEIELILRNVRLSKAERSAWLALLKGYRARWRRHSVCDVGRGVFGGIRIDVDSRCEFI